MLAIKRPTAPTATVCVAAALEIDDEVVEVAPPPEELCANPTGIKVAARTKESMCNIMMLKVIFRNLSSQLNR
jgi:hypothetical protein